MGLLSKVDILIDATPAGIGVENMKKYLYTSLEALNK